MTGTFGSTPSGSAIGRVLYATADEMGLSGLGLSLVTRLLGGVRVEVCVFTSLLSQRVFWKIPLAPSQDVQQFQLSLLFALQSNESNGDSFDWEVRYITGTPFTPDEGLAKTATVETGTVTLLTPTGLSAGDLYAASMTLDIDDETNPLEAGRAVFFEVEITDYAGMSGAVDLIGALMEF